MPDTADPGDDRCPECAGGGVCACTPGAEEHPCHACGGEGRVPPR